MQNQKPPRRIKPTPPIIPAFDQVCAIARSAYQRGIDRFEWKERTKERIVRGGWALDVDLLTRALSAVERQLGGYAVAFPAIVAPRPAQAGEAGFHELSPSESSAAFSRIFAEILKRHPDAKLPVMLSNKMKG